MKTTGPTGSPGVSKSITKLDAMDKTYTNVKSCVRKYVIMHTKDFNFNLLFLGSTVILGFYRIDPTVRAVSISNKEGA